MKYSNMINPNSKSQWLLLATLFFFLAFLGGIIALSAALPAGVIARGVSIGPFDVGGLTYEQTLALIKNQTSILETRGIDFVSGSKVVNLPSMSNSFSGPEFSYPIFNYLPEETAAQAWQLGRTGNWRDKFINRLTLRFSGQKIPLIFSLDEEKASQFLKDNFSPFENQPREARLRVVWEKDKSDYQIEIQPEEVGQVFDYPVLIKTLQENLAQLDSASIAMISKIIYPQIKAEEVSALRPQAEEWLARGQLELLFENQTFAMPLEKWSQWLRVVKKDGQVILDLDEELMAADLKEEIPGVEREMQEAKFVMKNSRVEEFSGGIVGQQLEIDETKEVIRQVLFAGAKSAGLVIKKSEPTSQLAKLNELGIKEIIGVGRSNFRGSPPNRIHNIKNGAKTLNGILISPDEVFSLLAALGKVDAEHGYRPELVIKGNKTTPEFGGGLCQIGTTSFRVALASGLPILERQNHSYRVSYYEPPVGVDATIYNPRPDFKFQNDTGHYILIQTRIEGTELIFEFWGTKDGRQAVQTEPIVFNRSSPPPAKLIETMDLPVGKKKCTERAHAGADAVFTYTITYIDGTVKTQEFKSHYRPWGEVCLIGVEKLSEPVEIKTESQP